MIENDIIARHLPELMVLARATYADMIIEKGADITMCGNAANWVASCTINDMQNGKQCMLWFNIGHDTKTASIDL